MELIWRHIVYMKLEKQLEKSLFELTVSNLKSGLRLKVAELMTSNRMQELNTLPGSNPILLLNKPPQGYVSLADEIGKDAEGVWYFDPKSRKLLYRFHRWRSWLFTAPAPWEGQISIQGHGDPHEENGKVKAKIEGVELIVKIRN